MLTAMPLSSPESSGDASPPGGTLVATVSRNLASWGTFIDARQQSQIMFRSKLFLSIKFYTQSSFYTLSAGSQLDSICLKDIVREGLGNSFTIRSF